MANIISPLPGVFYTSPGPDKDPFVIPGDRVSPGQAVGLVEVMKQFSEIRAESAGTVKSVEVENGASITPGTVVITLTED